MQLRPYQLEDIEKLKKMPSSACFNEPRTGKSTIALHVMQGKKTLIICPNSAVINWEKECQKWGFNDVIAVTGTRAQKLKKIHMKRQIYIVSYDSFKETASGKGLINEILDLNLEAVILDEAHRIKDRGSARARAVFATKHIPYKMALTGTPIPNKMYDIWSIMHWLFPKEYRSYWKFIDEFFGKTKITQQIAQYWEIHAIKPEKKAILQNIIKQFSIQRKRKDIMKWLPKKDYTLIKLQLNKQQEMHLRRLEKYYKYGDKYAQNTLECLLRHRQLCLSPELLNLKGRSPKTEYIQSYTQDYPERSVIIFSKFKSYINLLEKTLTKSKVGRITGEVSVEERAKIIKKFQNKEINVILLQIDTAKEAITLDTAEVIIFADKFPPVSDFLQASDRFIATTEEKAEKRHEIIDLVMQDTYEENIHKCLIENKNETDLINDYNKYQGRR